MYFITSINLEFTRFKVKSSKLKLASNIAITNIPTKANINNILLNFDTISLFVIFFVKNINTMHNIEQYTKGNTGNVKHASRIIKTA